MILTTLLAVCLLAICMALIAIRPILGRGPFRTGHACRMQQPGSSPARSRTASRNKEQH